jgi:shikimate kinase
MSIETRIVLTGFMGVGKSTVARFLASLLKCEKIDLDFYTEQVEKRTIAEIIHTQGEARYRQIETENLRRILATKEARIIALGGGAWTIEENRRLIKEQNLTTVWLESSFEHCWRNIIMLKPQMDLCRRFPSAAARSSPLKI